MADVSFVPRIIYSIFSCHRSGRLIVIDCYQMHDLMDTPDSKYLPDEWFCIILEIHN